MEEAIVKANLDFLSGGGEMGERIRSFDWSKTPLGSPEEWSQSLRTTVSIMLSNRFPMLLWWNEDYISVYNDAYIPVLGAKHPWGLGKPVKECWNEIWHILQPLIDTPFKGGESTWMEDIQLIIKRHGFTEETHFTIAYSPVPDEAIPGGIGGVLATVHEITEKIIGERAHDTLRELGAVTFEQKSLDVVYRNVAAALKKNNKDFPFALVYKIADDGKSANVVASAGVDKEQNVFPYLIDTANPTEITKDFCEAFRQNKLVVSEIKAADEILPKGAWDKAATQFAHLPVTVTGASHPYCIISAALNPFRKFDETFRQFCQLIGERVSLEINKMLALEEERKRAEALAEIDRAKTVFFSNISHEFRTPLTLMLGPLEELMQQPENKFGKKNLSSIETAHRNAMRLLKLVNTLLDFSRIESGRQKANFTLIDISSFTKKLATSFQTLMERAGLEYKINADAVDLPVYVDKQMWEQIVFNLLSNAFKYTLKGNVTLNLTSKADNIILEVIDTGIGIPEKELPHMFDRFHRVEGAKGRTYEGTGIGLSLIKELVNLHQGTITIKSKEGKGSTFTVVIPTGKEHLPVEYIRKHENDFSETLSNVYVEEAATLLEDVSAKNKLESVSENGNVNLKTDTVLVVDDNADMRQYLSTLLEKNYHIITANNGLDALHRIQEKQPALILADMMMPVMDGVQLVNKVKQNPATSHLPVIILSARAGEESRIEGYNLGADDYLVKPFSAKELLARVRAQIQMQKIRAQAQIQLEQKVTERTAELVYQKNFIDNLLKSTNHGVLSYTAIRENNEIVDFKIRYANDIALKQLNLPAEKVIGSTYLTVVPDAKELGFWQRIARVLNSGTSEIHEVQSPSYPEHYFSARFTPLDDGVTVTFIEITEQKKQARVLEEKNTQLEKMNKELESFTYISSHDLQEPLRKIQTFADRIAEKEKQNLSDSGLDYFNRIQNSAARMQMLIRDLLGFSRISTESRKFEKTDLNKVIEEVKTEFREIIEEKHATIEISGLCTVNVIPFQFRQLIYNLVSNALKFTNPQIHPHIVIKSRITKGKNLNNTGLLAETEYCHISISDNGIGFEPHFAEKIFEVFQKLHDRDEHDGTGIGLAVVKKIVENHNGFITATSELGKGTRFDIYFPTT